MKFKIPKRTKNWIICTS